MAVVRCFRSPGAESVASRLAVGFVITFAAAATDRPILLLVAMVSVLWFLIAPVLAPVVLTRQGVWCWALLRPWFINYGAFAAIPAMAPPINSMKLFTLRVIDTNKARSTRVRSIRVAHEQEVIERFVSPIPAAVPRNAPVLPIVIVDCVNNTTRVEVHVLHGTTSRLLANNTYRRFRVQASGIRVDIIELQERQHHEVTHVPRVAYRPLARSEAVVVHGQPDLRRWDVLCSTAPSELVPHVR